MARGKRNEANHTHPCTEFIARGAPRAASGWWGASGQWWNTLKQPHRAPLPPYTPARGTCRLLHPQVAVMATRRRNAQTGNAWSPPWRYRAATQRAWARSGGGRELATTGWGSPYAGQCLGWRGARTRAPMKRKRGRVSTTSECGAAHACVHLSQQRSGRTVFMSPAELARGVVRCRHPPGSTRIAQRTGAHFCVRWGRV